MASPAAWQPDPAGKHEYRWWDGQQWTEHVADAGQASTDPLPADAAAPTPSGGEAGQPGAQDAGGPAAGDPPAAAWEQPGAGQAGGTPAWGGATPSQPAGQPALGQQGMPPAGGGPTWGQAGGQPPATGATDGVAIAAIVIGILSLLIAWIPVVGLAGLAGGIIALVLGFVARGRIRRNGTAGNGAAITGIVTGILAVLLGLLVNVLVLFFMRSVEGGLGTFVDFAACMEEHNDPDLCEQILEDGLGRFFDD